MVGESVQDSDYDGRLWKDRVVSIDDWFHASRGNDNVNPLPLLDVRTGEDHQRQRIDGLCRCQVHAADDSASLTHVEVIHIPMTLLRERSFELPPRHVKFALLLPDFNLPSDNTSEDLGDHDLQTSLDELITFLLGPTQSQRQVQESLSGASDSTPQSKKVKITKKQPWKVQQILVATTDFWKRARALHICADDNAPLLLQTSLRALPRLWEPDPMVESVLLPQILGQWRPRSERCVVFDLGSGAGRDVSFLAESLVAASKLSSRHNADNNSLNDNGSVNVTVVGADHRYKKPEERVKVVNFWGRRGVGSPITSALTLDVSRWEIVKSQILSLVGDSSNVTSAPKMPTTDGNEIDRPSILAIYMVRYLNRGLLQSIANDRASLPRGTLVGISHFAKPYQDAPWPFDHPSPATVLERNELRDLFCPLADDQSIDDDRPKNHLCIPRSDREDGWELIRDEINQDTDHGRTMIHFVARRR